jgi:c-di-GMP-binding flagellar brake protein YcgR
MIERRQSIRVECELPSSCRNMDPHFPPKVLNVVVKNISRGGVRIRLNEFIPIQCHLHFYLQLPNQDTIEIQIAPAWVVELPHLGVYEMGARFVDMSSDQEDAIQGFQYRSLLQKMPSHSNVLKDLQKEPPKDPGVAA